MLNAIRNLTLSIPSMPGIYAANEQKIWRPRKGIVKLERRDVTLDDGPSLTERGSSRVEEALTDQRFVHVPKPFSLLRKLKSASPQRDSHLLAFDVTMFHGPSILRMENGGVAIPQIETNHVTTPKGAHIDSKGRHRQALLVQNSPIANIRAGVLRLHNISGVEYDQNHNLPGRVKDAPFFDIVNRSSEYSFTITDDSVGGIAHSSLNIGSTRRFFETPKRLLYLIFLTEMSEQEATGIAEFHGAGTVDQWLANQRQMFGEIKTPCSSLVGYREARNAA